MINLIPNQEKKKMVKDFYFRLLVVFFMMLGFSIFIASAAILPSYFLSVAKKNVATLRLESQKNEPIADLDKKTLTAIEDLKKKLALFQKAKGEKFSVAEKAFKEIASRKTSGISVEKIYYENSAQDGKKISVQGKASSREQLVLFGKALEDDSAFKEVDLPISNLIKGSNIEFYLTLIPS